MSHLEKYENAYCFQNSGECPNNLETPANGVPGKKLAIRDIIEEQKVNDEQYPLLDQKVAALSEGLFGKHSCEKCIKETKKALQNTGIEMVYSEE